MTKKPDFIQMPTTPGRPETPPSMRDFPAVERANGLIGKLYLDAQHAAEEEERNARLDLVIDHFFADSGITVQPAMRPFLRRLAVLDLNYTGDGAPLLVQCVAAMKMVKEVTK